MFRRPCLAAVLVVLVAPETAAAGTVRDARVATSRATDAPCQTALRRGAPGVVTRPVLVSGPAQVSVRMNGGGDWDVALFDARGRALAAAASPDAVEVASGWATERSTLTLQACRRSGGSAVAVTVSEDPITSAEVAEARAEAPQLVSVNTPTRAAKAQLLALDLDLTEHGGTRSVGVVLHGAADRAALTRAGLTYRVLVKDLVAKDAREASAVAAATTLPSGHTSYRTLADYESELKTLAAQNPGLVRLFALPNKTLENREVLGIEISENVTANDGKPAFLNMGVHHAREWPAGEHAMEWAYELINGYKAGDPRATNIVRKSRNLVVPIVNPDGFNSSRSAPLASPDGNPENVDDTAYIAARPSEYRRKNCRLGTTDTPSCPPSAGLAEPGVDPNRNYGQFWGGPGSDTNPATQTYRGTGPFSEAESRNIQWLVSHNQVATLITNHTTAGLVLRAPGLAVIGPPVDEKAGYQDLGDAMAKENGYFSQKGYELYDTTGTTEDWSYNATGGFGFTFEIYCGDPNYVTGDCDAPSFHPTFATMAKEWDGTSTQADHTGDPAFPAGYDGKGNREAYYLAAESTINETRHSILEGTAPAGTRLRLTKDFKTETYQGAATVDDHLETVYDVGASGSFRWHVNPSTRPIVAKATGSPNAGPPSPPQSASGNPATTPPTMFADHAFTVPSGGDNAAADFLVKWTSPASDWDIELFQDTNGNGAVDAGEPSLGSSAQAATDNEQVTAANPTGSYVLRVTNYAAVEPYDVTVTYSPPAPFKAAQTETYTLACEHDGAVFHTQQVFVARGQTANVICPAPKRPASTIGDSGGSGTGACAATAGFSSVGFAPRGRGARFDIVPKSKGAQATVSVFQQSSGRRVTGERLVARFTGKSEAFTWNGKPTTKRRITDGYYFARYTLGTDTRRITLRRSGGQFKRVSDFHRRASCDLVPSYKLTRPVFGGTAVRSLGISYRVSRRATVAVTVLRGSRTIKKYGTRTVAANRTVRLSLPARGLARGEYKIRLVAKAGSDTVTSTLVSRRL